MSACIDIWEEDLLCFKEVLLTVRIQEMRQIFFTAALIELLALVMYATREPHALHFTTSIIPAHPFPQRDNKYIKTGVPLRHSVHACVNNYCGKLQYKLQLCQIIMSNRSLHYKV